VGRKAMGFVTVWERAASAPGNLTMPSRASTSRDNQRVRDPTLNSACELDASCDRLRKLHALVSLHSHGSRGMWPRRGGTVPVWLARRPVVLHHSSALDRSRSASRPRYRIRSSPWPAVRMRRHPSDKCITDRRELTRRTGRATQGWPPEPSRGRPSDSQHCHGDQRGRSTDHLTSLIMHSAVTLAGSCSGFLARRARRDRVPEPFPAAAGIDSTVSAKQLF